MEVSLAPHGDAHVDVVTLHKMALLYNAVHDGWTVRKNNDRYIFSKPHENRREVFLDSFVKTFMRENLDLGKLAAADGR